MPLQYRPSQKHPFYNPQRDIAYCFPSLWRVALVGLEQENWASWYGDYLKQVNCDYDALYEAAGAFAESFKRVAERPEDYPDPSVVFEETGFVRCHPAAQLVIAARLGQVCIGAFFTAVREVSKPGEGAPLGVDLQTLVQKADQLACEWKRLARAGEFPWTYSPLSTSSPSQPPIATAAAAAEEPSSQSET